MIQQQQAQQPTPPTTYHGRRHSLSDLKRLPEWGSNAMGFLSRTAHQATLDDNNPISNQQPSYHYSASPLIASGVRGGMKMKVPFVSKIVDPTRRLAGSFVAHTIDEGAYAISQQQQPQQQ